MAAKIGSNRGEMTLVTTPYDMAKVLFNASACSAAAYALAAHEDAFEMGDEKRIRFWHEVCRDLKTLREQLDRAA